MSDKSPFSPGTSEKFDQMASRFVELGDEAGGAQGRFMRKGAAVIQLNRMGETATSEEMTELGVACAGANREHQVRQQDLQRLADMRNKFQQVLRII